MDFEVTDKGLTLVTGGTGFVGSHLVRKLLHRGFKVRAFARPGSVLKNLEGLELDMASGDITDPESVRAAMTGCAFVYHAAADYRLWAPDPAVLYRANVGGTRNVLEAAGAAGVRRIVYTSTVGALGISKNGHPAGEESPVTLGDMIGHYKRSKFLAEAEASAAARRGLPVVIVNPSTPVGSMDIKPTPTGQMIVDFLNGRIPAYLDTGLNLVDVEDVAEGHLLAMEKGRVGERYILGHRNLTLKEILEILGRVSGRKAPTVRLPRSAAMALAAVSTGLSFITRRPPRVPWEGVRMAGKKMFYDSSKAVRELGFHQGPVEDALEKAVVWFRANGYVK
ncbi:MAG: NAD-dependent epimerase/dehydratase family protein [Candidatus Omnitrophica bacterium]|nr:NAD-dependent epimerase/dehydratase family protein [Candidatus Omnitrophota bacterium]